MAGGSDSVGVAAVGAVAGVLGLVHVASGGLVVLAGAATTGALVLAVARFVLGLFLLPTAVGLLRGVPWSRWVGVVGLGGLAVVQFLPLLAGETMAVPLAGILLSSACALYLLLAGQEFDGIDERAIGEDTDPHDFVR
jgi:hypothetical protein